VAADRISAGRIFCSLHLEQCCPPPAPAASMALHAIHHQFSLHKKELSKLNLFGELEWKLSRADRQKREKFWPELFSPKMDGGELCNRLGIYVEMNA